MPHSLALMPGESEVQGHLGWHRKLEANKNYMTLFLNNNNRKKRKEPQRMSHVSCLSNSLWHRWQGMVVPLSQSARLCQHGMERRELCNCGHWYKHLPESYCHMLQRVGPTGLLPSPDCELSNLHEGSLKNPLNDGLFHFSSLGSDKLYHQWLSTVRVSVPHSKLPAFLCGLL